MQKKKSRRAFLDLAAKTGVAIPFLGTGLWSCDSKPAEKNQTENPIAEKLKILILGGTSFLGPHQVAYALVRGHSVSTFTRGKTLPTVHQDLFKKVEMLIGDRKDNLTALENRKWDVVIDNSGRDVDWTKRTAELLKENVGIYLYTSSTGVYYPYLKDDIQENTELVKTMPADLEDEEMEMEYGYGVMKTNSELAAIAAFGKDRTIVVRPTYMIGPADKTDRFIHWPIRLSRGGEMLVPGKPNDMVQYMDVRDVAEWMIRLAEEKKTGTYNAVGPEKAQNMYQFVEEAQGAFDVKSSMVKIDDYDFLKENKVFYLVPWIMPEENNYGSALVNNQKAIANGLTFRPLTQTINDTYTWWNSDAITPEKRKEVEENPNSVLRREKEILAKWKAKVLAKE